jgi:thioredoxin-dependent peroxiredoxin
MKKATAKPAKSKTVRTKPAAPKESHPLEGQQAPGFELPNAQGFPVKLSELTGKGPVVLYFYPKDMTPGCTQEACDFRDRLADIHASGAEVVGISTDSPQSHQKFQDKHGLNFPLLSDTAKSVVKDYGVYKKKSLYGREFMGIERTTFLIDRTGTIRKVFPKVKVKDHAKEVMAELAGLK